MVGSAGAGASVASTGAASSVVVAAGAAGSAVLHANMPNARDTIITRVSTRVSVFFIPSSSLFINRPLPDGEHLWFFCDAAFTLDAVARNSDLHISDRIMDINRPVPDGELVYISPAKWQAT